MNNQPIGSTTNFIITVPLTPESLRAFQLYQEQIKVLLDAKIFECEHGKITINMHEGHIASVHVEKRTYTHGAK